MSNYISFFAQTFLFRDIEQKSIEKILKGVKIERTEYQRGECIYTPDEFSKKVGFVYRGECAVGRQTGNAQIPLNVAKKHDSFGLVTVFSERDEFPTVVTAKTASTVLSIYADDLRRLMSENPQISQNIICFLTKKIHFLNDKIAAFSGGSVEEKLAGYIWGLKRKHNSLEFPFNKKKSSEALNCGRASLYRAIDSLQDAGYITVEEKKIIINDPIGLERILK